MGLEFSGLALKKLFANVDLEIEDLYLLESSQIEYLPGWIPERELALVLWAHPSIDRFLRIKCPEVTRFLDAAKARFVWSEDRSDLARAEEEVVWTIADLIVYNKCPDVYDGLEFHSWDFAEVTSITPLDGKVVVDVGSGTGRVALSAATRQIRCLPSNQLQGYADSYGKAQLPAGTRTSTLLMDLVTASLFLMASPTL